ncbi:MAG: DNA-directed RNA polymerase subunit beta, partial [Desulfosalsimonadaceae bacterium]|nr:DNA-directed RNA polymerase subunit beta [Desulfosalsimonadaceae bacterium]
NILKKIARISNLKQPHKEKIIIRKKQLFRELNPEFLKGQRPGSDILNPETGQVVVKKGRIFTKRAIKELQDAGVELIPISKEDLYGRVVARDIIHPKTFELIAKSNVTIEKDLEKAIISSGIDSFDVLVMEGLYSSNAIQKTLLVDKVTTKEDALIDIYRRLRPGNPATPEVAQEFVDHLFFRNAYYDLSGVGRLKINHRLKTNTPIDIRTLRKEDILLTAKTLVELRDNQGPVDDIDHLGNRRVRAVGELLENQYRIGLVRMERAIKERMSMQEVDALMPNDLVNPKPVSAVVKEFFGTSQLSQFLDQTNPLSETTHKRRLSALGPGGLTRDRAGFEVRDVHPSHYGRICPIETPEGPNIGLIVSLCTYARVNEFGFIETPYRVVKDATVTDEIKMLSAFEEQEHPIAQANAPVNEKNQYVNQNVISRVAGEFMRIGRDQIELMDISPNQLVSASASLIPFLENDDANRALMGSNMMRQAVPLLNSRAPLVGTGIEGVVARDSGVTVVARRDGKVVYVDASRIVLQHEPSGDPLKKDVTIYNLSKFIRSNQNTCFNHRPIIKKGTVVKAGEVIADGPATEKGELALGKNVTVAFMPWGGYNFEDSILVSERLVKDGVFTSIHIEEFEVLARDTKLGKEEITRDIPNVGEEALRDLDDCGIIRLGAEVGPGDILVGKVTPKGETQLSPEEKLLRAIFGEKAGEVKDTSLRVPPGGNGIVIDAKVFSRRGIDKDDRSRAIENDEIALLEKDRDDEVSIIEEMARKEIAALIVGMQCVADLTDGKKIIIPKNTKIELKHFDKLPISKLETIAFAETAINDQLNDLIALYREKTDLARKAYEHQLAMYERGDDLPPGVIKMIKIYVAMKRTLSVGDKMAGRHGNKGVVSRILPEEDLPYFQDGRTVDMFLNPLGVPSRMNVG